MKNPYLKYTLQFTAIFFAAALFFVAVDEDAPPIWERSVGDYIINVFGLVLFALIFFVLPIMIKYWRAKRRNPEPSNYHSRFSDEQEALDAFANPHDPILNPQATKRE